MIVREDDTLVCENCYAEEGDKSPFDLPRHRWAFALVYHGRCESCGVEAGAKVAPIDQT